MRRLLLVQAWPDLFAEAHRLHAGAAAEPPGRRGLRLRQGRPGAQARRREEGRSAMTFLVDPGKRVYVRHIEFAGVDPHQRPGAAARDAPAGGQLALQRRAGALASSACSSSPYVEKVEFEKNKVDGADDLVDVKYTIKEGPSARSPAASAIRPRRSSCSTAAMPTAISWARASASRCELNAGLYSKVYSFSADQPVPEHRQPLAHGQRALHATSRSSSPPRRTSPPRPWHWAWNTAIRSPSTRACAWARRCSVLTC